jgi:proteasome accessory factor B
MHELPAHPHGWSFDAIQRELSIGERTLLRYVEACKSELVDAHGEPLLEVVQRGPRRMLRLKDGVNGGGGEPAPLSAVSTFFTLAMVRSLEGTVMKESVDALWDKMLERVPAAARPRLSNLDRKFHAISFVPNDYAQHSEIIDQVIQAVVREYRLTVDYGGMLGDGKEHDLEPYTLLSYRGGLWLVGRNHALDKIVWLAVERIRSVKPTPGDGPRGRARFSYPRDFHAEAYADGMFGVVDGPETEVELAIANSQTEAYLRNRTIHSSQRFVPGNDGRTRLLMTVRGTAELTNWIMSLTPWVEVIRPVELRHEVAHRLEDAAARYTTRQEAAAKRG